MRIPRTDSRRPLLGALLLCTLCVTACGPAQEGGPPPGETPATGTDEQPVVYGTDDRRDVYAHADATLRARAKQSTVALMVPWALDTSDPNNVTFKAPTLQSAFNLCSFEHFLTDPTPARCSGTLIDDDLVLTAGSCITSASACSGTRFVFNFYRNGAGTLQPVTTEDIFSCQSLVVREQAKVNGRNLDYAIVRLDRAATPRFVPAPIRASNTAMEVGANVAVIGSGSGIPFKIDSGGSVRAARMDTMDYFVATTDTFGGNWGSGVYEMRDYTVAGIQVRGETDYIPSQGSGTCNIVNWCSEPLCRGQDITYVRPAIDAYCAVATSTRLCTGGPPPPLANSFTYSASATNNATVNTTNRVVALEPGQKITLGTCGVTGATYTGDTWLRLYDPAGTEVASNDNACGGPGSNLAFTASTAGNYEIRAGCYSSSSCTAIVAWTVQATTTGSTGSFTYSASNTNSAQTNTTNGDVELFAGQRLSFGTCTLAGASGTGDTFLRLYNNAGNMVASSDDSNMSGCGRLSYTTYTVPEGAGGPYQIRAGCYSNTSCSGTVAWTAY